MLCCNLGPVDTSTATTQRHHCVCFDTQLGNFLLYLFFSIILCFELLLYKAIKTETCVLFCTGICVLSVFTFNLLNASLPCYVLLVNIFLLLLSSLQSWLVLYPRRKICCAKNTCASEGAV